MEKILIGAVAGIFIGAFAMEILSRKSPQTVKNIEDKAAKVAERFITGSKSDQDSVVEPATS